MKNNTKNNVCYIRKTTETKVMNPKWCSFFFPFVDLFLLEMAMD